MNEAVPTVSLVDAEIVCIDQGGDTITLILSGRKRDFVWALSGDVAAIKSGHNFGSDAVRFEFIEGQKRSIEQTIQRLQQIYIKLSE